MARVDNKNNNPKIILSRTSPVFLQRQFEMEVPEINDGLITIKKIARIPGERAKIAVESYDDRIAVSYTHLALLFWRCPAHIRVGFFGKMEKFS